MMMMMRGQTPPEVWGIGLSSVLRPRQHSIGYMGDGFYRSKDPTNSIKVLKEQIVHRQIKSYNKQTNTKHNKSPSLSHAHTVVWECCKDDRQSQWEVAKFDPQPTLNPLTDRHQIWNTWLRRGYLLPKSWAQSAQGILPPPHIPEIYTKNLRIFTALFQLFRAPTDEAIGRILRSFDAVLRKEVPFVG